MQRRDSNRFSKPIRGRSSQKKRRISRLFGVLGATMIAVCIAACEPAADVSNPKPYSRDGLSLLIPDNWKVTEDASENGYRYLFIESPGNALTILQFMPGGDSWPLAEFAAHFSAGAKDQTPVGEIVDGDFLEIEHDTGEQTLKGIRERFSIVLLGEEVPHVRDFFFVRSQGAEIFVINQIAVEDLEKVKPGFDLILGSL
ncbi:MAG: hypothetical protein CMN76_15355 [Spirochaetaceae bacterium]|nr:hypothetical protein [Spirochaetaceae bacterium]